MSNRQGSIIGQIYGGAGVPGVQVMRCYYAGEINTNDRVLFGDNQIIGSSLQDTLPPGAELLDALLFISDASSTLSLEVGYAAADGATGTTSGVADVSAAYFTAITSVSASERLRANSANAPITVQRATVPTMTVTTGGVNTSAVFELDVYYRYNGNQGITTEDA